MASNLLLAFGVKSLYLALLLTIPACSISATDEGAVAFPDPEKGPDLAPKTVPLAPACQGSRLEQHPSCVGDCPIVGDWTVACESDYIESVSVALSATSVGVAVGGNGYFDDDVFARVEAGGVEAVQLPFVDRHGRLLLAASASGEYTAAFGQEDADNYNAMRFVTLGTDSALVETIPGKYWQAYALEYSSDDRPFVIVSEPSEPWFAGAQLATRAGDSWETTLPLESDPFALSKYTLTAEGLLVTVGWENTGVGTEIIGALVPGLPKIVLANFETNLKTKTLQVAHAPPAGLPAGSAAFVAAIQREEGLSVVWPDAEGAREVAIPDTALMTFGCGAGVQACAGSCLNEASGASEGGYAIARTADGAAWVAYVVTHMSQTLTFTEHCTYEPATDTTPAGEVCTCDIAVSADASASELHVVRLKESDAAPEEILVLPIAPFANGDSFVKGESFDGAIDMRALGDEVAIAARVDDAGSRAVRVLRLHSPG